MRKLRLSIATLTAKTRLTVYHTEFLNQSVILGKPRHVLVFQAERAFGPEQGGGDSEKP